MQDSPANLQKLSEALVKAQMESRGVTKDKANDFHRYRYASTEALILEAQGCLHTHGLALHPVGSEIVAVAGSVGVIIPPDKNQAASADLLTLLILRRRWRLTHSSGEAMEWGQDWPIIPERGRPFDKATAAADTASLGYTLRDLLLLARVEKGTDLDDDERDAKPQDRQPARQGNPFDGAPPRDNVRPPPRDPTPRAPANQPAAPTDEGHDPSWQADRAAFCARLGELGVNYDTVKAVTASINKPKPSQMNTAQRKALVGWLAGPAGKAAIAAAFIPTPTE